MKKFSRMINYRKLAFGSLFGILVVAGLFISIAVHNSYQPVFAAAAQGNVSEWSAQLGAGEVFPACGSSAVNGACAASHYNCTSGVVGPTAAYPTNAQPQWQWWCDGLYGGTNILCSELMPVNGVCGSTQYSCTSGTSASNVSGTTSYTWSCAGTAGGSTVSCSLAKPSCPADVPYTESRSGSIATYCAAMGVTCGSGQQYVSSLSCDSAPGWAAYGAACTAPSCGGCGCVAAPVTPPTSASCTTPWGATVASGSTATGYSTSSVTSPATCAPYAQTSTCTNGTFSPSLASYPNASCTANAASSCSNGAINYAACNQCASGYAYVGSSCVACSNGGCSGGGGSAAVPYGSLSCNDGGSNPTTCTPPASSCTTPWGTTVASGASVQAFQTATVSSPATCASDPVQTRTCNNGTLSGSYQNENCSQLAPTASMSASPIRVKSGETSLITWSSSSVSSCTVSGPGLSSSTENGSQSIVITAQSTYTITCQTTSSPITQSVTVNIVPTFQEF